ncbi:hypothetical protein AB0C87_24765 [Actinomadura sp. NPDC048021]|uniref:hypothetical protein n=1 Tax=Actinomadura sp. NPDC048021 TaxID=3155385 RepID=UPI0033DC3976
MFKLNPNEVYSVTDFDTSPITGKPVVHVRTGAGYAFQNDIAFGIHRYALILRAEAARLDY